MRIMGISGLAHGVDFKQRRLPGLSSREYRIVQGLDSAAALVTEAGINSAAAEERFSRQKGTGEFPAGAIRYCLAHANLLATDIDALAHAFCYERYASQFTQGDSYARDQFHEVYSIDALRSAIEEHFPNEGLSQKVHRVEHHLAHAASAYFLSGFDESLVFVADGMGEVHSTTVAVGTRGGLTVLRQIPAVHSLGILYGVFTLYLGFTMNLDEYKVMGLAAHGDPARYFNEMMELVHLHDDGTYTIPVLFANTTLVEKETYRGTLRRLSEIFGPPRLPDAEITRRHADVAAALQACLQAALLHLLGHFRRATGQTHLCIAGGVGLNCTANGFINRSRLFRRIFVQPAAGDDGAALGAALFMQHTIGGGVENRHIGTPLWGPSYPRHEIAVTLAKHPECRNTLYADADELASEVAARLAAGQIGAWFQGRMEFGPRALGSRSILADPRDPGMRERLNTAVKKREEFRPFAPAVPAEDVRRFFDLRDGDEEVYAHMLLTAPVRHEYRSLLPAVTHVDGSARLQTVSRAADPPFWTLLRKFGELTGFPVLVNTSFNVRGQPIVCSPEEAIDTFTGTDIQFLAIGDYLVERR